MRRNEMEKASRKMRSARKDGRRGMNLRHDLYSQLLETAADAGLPIISTDTCARIAAIVHTFNHERMLDAKFVADAKHIMKRFRLDGGGIPDPEFAALARKYSKEAEEYGAERKKVVPWAARLCMERYGFKLFW